MNKSIEIVKFLARNQHPTPIKDILKQQQHFHSNYKWTIPLRKFHEAENLLTRQMIRLLAKGNCKISHRSSLFAQFVEKEFSPNKTSNLPPKEWTEQGANNLLSMLSDERQSKETIQETQESTKAYKSQNF